MPKWAVEKQYYEMPELVGFQTMVILDPNGMSFDALCVFGLDFQLLFKSSSSYCEVLFVYFTHIYFHKILIASFPKRF